MMLAALCLAGAGLWQCKETNASNGEEEEMAKVVAEEKEVLPGENLDLYATLDLFKNSKSLEAFERSLNDKSKKINNLDLNADSTVDYVRVIDRKKDEDHAIVLQAVIGKNDFQDVAVIEIDKTGEKTAHVQIVGDEKLYGDNNVVQPKSEKGKASKAGFFVADAVVFVNVWYWPCITYIYSPAYTTVWVSPWYWDYYPSWWYPWPPVAYAYYYPVVYTYHGYYVPAPGPSFVHIHGYYQTNYYTHSPVVYNKIRNNEYYYGPRRGGGNPGGRGNYGDDAYPRGRRGDPGRRDDPSVGGRRDPAPGRRAGEQPRTDPRDAGRRDATPRRGTENPRSGERRESPRSPERSTPRTPERTAPRGTERRGDRPQAQPPRQQQRDPNVSPRGGYERRPSAPQPRHQSPSPNVPRHQSPSAPRQPMPGGRPSAPAPRPRGGGGR